MSALDMILLVIYQILLIALGFCLGRGEELIPKK